MYNIGILQLTQNLDDAVHGFKNGLKQLDIAAQIHYLNADGNVDRLPKLATELAEKKVDLIFACSTPAAKAAINLDADIPVVFTPVFDPVGSCLVESLSLPNGKATGVSGMVMADAKIAFISRLLPKAHTIGILYHTADSNSLVEVHNIHKQMGSLYDIVDIPVKQAEDLSNLPDLLPTTIDALFLPIGQIIEENFPTIAYYTDTINLPIVASHPPNVSAGAVGALVANHYQLGVECAKKSAEILGGKAPGTIPVDIVKKPEIILNLFAAQNLGLDLPADLIAEASEVFE